MVTIKSSWYRNPTRSPGDRTEMDFQPPADALCGVRREQSVRRGVGNARATGGRSAKTDPITPSSAAVAQSIAL
ncbi:unnamed protein product [Macrosiphum euphorbiae]|uniref:Uncharacterized protein n=1 Tax=Macrosiphum euphorbiae TaxID=13131 RepID=A0AAV0WZN3_9HEMI|nr:unnamed protein product [Macrosiphum euphorbiae]